MTVKSNGHAKKKTNGHNGAAKMNGNGTKFNGNGHNKDPVTDQETAEITLLANLRSYENLSKRIHDNDITHEYAAKALKEQFEAMETKFCAHQGEVISSVDVINWPVRQKALEIYLAITGAVAPKQDKVEHAGVVVYRPDPRIKKEG